MVYHFLFLMVTLAFAGNAVNAFGESNCTPGLSFFVSEANYSVKRQSNYLKATETDWDAFEAVACPNLLSDAETEITEDSEVARANCEESQTFTDGVTMMFSCEAPVVSECARISEPVTYPWNTTGAPSYVLHFNDLTVSRKCGCMVTIDACPFSIDFLFPKE